MRIVSPSATLVWVTPDPEKVIETHGRIAYRSEGKITGDSHVKFIRMLMRRNHMSVLEHAVASVRMTTDIAIGRELTRHRLSSYTQESTRFCNYSNDRFGNEIAFVEPPDLGEDRNEWILSCERAETSYLRMIRNGRKPEIARSVLPMCTAAEIGMTCNFREWLWVLHERYLNPEAHPQMRELMGLVFHTLEPLSPTVFGVMNPSGD